MYAKRVLVYTTVGKLAYGNPCDCCSNQLGGVRDSQNVDVQMASLQVTGSDPSLTPVMSSTDELA